MKLATLFACLIIVSGCTHNSPNRSIMGKVHTKTTADHEIKLINHPDNPSATMNIRYLGVGGYSFEVNGERLITPPFYSNPGFWHAALPFSISPNTNVEERFLRDLSGSDDPSDGIVAANQVQGVLVGHSHYDHLLDLPPLLKGRLKDVKVYGTPTMAAILGTLGISCKTEPRAISMESDVGVNWRTINSNKRIRVFPINSSHSPHVKLLGLGLTAQTGKRRCNKDFTAPRSAWGWKMGEIYAYLIDFRNDEGDILFRMYYQDTASNLDSNETLDIILKEREVDIAIITFASAGNVSDYPSEIMKRLDAALYIIGHWENFFGQHEAPLPFAPFNDEKEFVKNLEKALPVNSHWVLANRSRGMNITREGQQTAQDH